MFHGEVQMEQFLLHGTLDVTIVEAVGLPDPRTAGLVEVLTQVRFGFWKANGIIILDFLTLCLCRIFVP